jgi:hypothetical protein
MRMRGVRLIGVAALATLAWLGQALAAPLPTSMPTHDSTFILSTFHSGRTTSFYCYPRNYWWFYRPYTTAADGLARCMPYFHYPVRPPRAGGPGVLK